MLEHEQMTPSPAELKDLYDASVAAKERLDAAMTATPHPQQEVYSRG
jgi:hypothetical protein